MKSISVQPSLALTLLLLASGAWAHGRDLGGSWIGSWHASSTSVGVDTRNATVRSVVRLSVGGSRVRLRFSNLFGHSVLVIGHVVIGSGNQRADVTFRGAKSTRISPGSEMTSDPVVIKASAAATLAISVYYPLGTVVPLTLNYRNAESNVVLSGDRTNAVPSDPQGKRLGYTPFLTAVQVENLGASGAIVVMGDSMTDGGSNHWPAMLANRLAAAGKPYAVLNAAVGGNRLLRDTEDPAYGGQSALKRFDRDVLSQPRVKYLILYEGINDICMEDGIHLTSSAREIESAISSLTGRAHAHGIRVYVATLVQIKGRPSDYYSPAKEDVRKEVNRWIRSTKNIDAVVDFDHAVADSSDPDKMDGRFHNGDFHPNEEGNRILSDSFDLRLFR